MLRQATRALIPILLAVATLAVVVAIKGNAIGYEAIGYSAPVFFMLVALMLLSAVCLIDKKRIVASLVCLLVAPWLFSISWDATARMSPSMETSVGQYLGLLFR